MRSVISATFLAGVLAPVVAHGQWEPKDLTKEPSLAGRVFSIEDNQAVINGKTLRSIVFYPDTKKSAGTQTCKLELIFRDAHADPTFVVRVYNRYGWMIAENKKYGDQIRLDTAERTRLYLDLYHLGSVLEFTPVKRKPPPDANDPKYIVILGVQP